MIDPVRTICPFCPEDDTHPVQVDFFGIGCQIDGVASCDICYRVYCLTADNDAQQDERILEESIRIVAWLAHNPAGREHDAQT